MALAEAARGGINQLSRQHLTHPLEEMAPLPPQRCFPYALLVLAPGVRSSAPSAFAAAIGPEVRTTTVAERGNDTQNKQLILAIDVIEEVAQSPTMLRQDERLSFQNFTN